MEPGGFAGKKDIRDASGKERKRTPGDAVVAPFDLLSIFSESPNV